MKRCRGLLRTMAVFGALGPVVAGGAVLGQVADPDNDAKPWQLFIKYPKQAGVAGKIELRPNVAQPVLLELQNNGQNDKKDIKVYFVCLDSQGKTRTILHGDVPEIGKGGGKVVLAFPPVKSKEQPQDAAPVDWDSMPLKFELWVKEQGIDTKIIKVPVIVSEPAQYMTSVPNYEASKKRFSVKLTTKPRNVDPPCEVKLALSPDYIPGLIARVSEGLLKFNLDSKNFKLDDKGSKVHETDLSAVNLRFAPNVSKVARAYVTVDGYERAFGYTVNFDAGTPDPLAAGSRVRFKSPRYFNPDAEVKTGAKGEIKSSPKLTVSLEIDGASTAKWVEIGFDRAGGGQYNIEYLLPGPREQIISLGTRAGTPEFKVLVRDWKVDIVDPGDARGSHKLRVRLLDVKRDPLTLIDEHKDSALLRYFDAPLDHSAPLAYDKAKQAVSADIVIDASPPEDVAFVKAPAKAAPGATIVIKAKAAARDKDNQAPIAKVQFFVGDPAKEKPVDGVLDKETDIWQASIMIPKEAKENVTVTARATTATELSAVGTTTIAVDAGNLADSRITGVVKWNNMLQWEEPVRLIDANTKAEIAKTKTNKDGVYLFDKVKAGNYKIEARSRGMFRATVDVVVQKEKGEKIEKNITLTRIP